MSRLNAIFEEDLEMQDALDDMIEMDDVEDIIIGAIEDRGGVDGSVHLFDSDEPVNDDGLTEEEEHQANVALLTDEDLTDDNIEDDLELDDEIMSSVEE